MNMKESVVTCYRKSFSKKGRASRSEYWWFVLYLNCVPFVVHAATLAGIVLAAPHFVFLLLKLVLLLLVLSTPFSLAFAQTRRLHDSGRSGWWTIATIAVPLMTVAGLGEDRIQAARTHSAPPLIQSFIDGQVTGAHGWIVAGFLAWAILGITIFAFMVMPGNTGDNRFGPDPFDRGPSCDDRSPPSSGSGARESLPSQAPG